MEEFAVIGLDTQEKKAEAEAILKELGYRSDEGWNKDYRTEVDCDFVVTFDQGIYCYHNHDGDKKEVTLEQLRAKLKP